MASQESLKETLAELRAELRQLEASGVEGDALPEDARDALRDAAREIEQALEGDGADDSLSARLQEAIERFEGSHPTLTGIVGRVVDALSDLGI